jgi:hypothetical protein
VKARFSLRTLLVILTLIAIACGIVSGKIASDRGQERLLAKALERAQADGTKVQAYDWEVFVSPAGRAVSASIEGGPMSVGTATALVEARCVTNLTMGVVPSTEVEKVLSAGFNRRVLPHSGFATWERRMSFLGVVWNVAIVTAFCSLVWGLPLLLIYLSVKWFVQSMGRIFPTVGKKLPP